MTLQERQKEKISKLEYRFTRWDKYDYSILSNILAKNSTGRGRKIQYNDAFVMLDTETSKKEAGFLPKDNHIVAFTISVRSESHNICTLYGARPTECIKCIEKIIKALPGKTTYIYVHNLSYDWTFLFRFMIKEWGYPERQLNVKPLYPLMIEFRDPNIILKDSYLLSQRSLERWAKDLNVEHQKAVGSWDYDLIRDQSGRFTAEELKYIENDTLAGVECLDAMRINLGKHIYSMPYTATGIPREALRKIGKKYGAHDKFLKVALDWDQLQKAENCYHGGYTHANRHYLNQTITGEIKCYDFASSYPFIMLTGQFPAEKFTPMRNCSLRDILNIADKYAFMFKLILIKPRLKTDALEMPALQLSKCVKHIDAVVDNGRILTAGYVEIWLTELDAKIIDSQYDYDKHLCVSVEYARKSYLPRWFRDYVFKCFEEKTAFKGGDPVLYSLAKSRLNSLYGLCCMHAVREEVKQDYKTGLYEKEPGQDLQEQYAKYLKRYTSILPYQWGVWVTNAAMYNLFRLGSCCSEWIYSDTDSVYGMEWDQKKVDDYNNECKQKLIDAGYGPVNHKGRDYWLGVAELDGIYTEFRTVGSKRYACRSKDDGDIHITVAGVPKKTGAKCLNDNIENFTTGMIFDGATTGKKTHFYLHHDIYTDEKGNLTADSVDLQPCDYLLKAESEIDWEKIFYEEIGVINYEIL